MSQQLINYLPHQTHFPHMENFNNYVAEEEDEAAPHTEAVQKTPEPADTSSNVSLIPEDPNSSAELQQNPEIEQDAETSQDPEDPRIERERSASIEFIKIVTSAEREQENPEEHSESPEPVVAEMSLQEPMEVDDDGPPILEVQSPKDYRDAGGNIVVQERFIAKLMVETIEEQKPEIGGGLLALAEPADSDQPAAQRRRRKTPEKGAAAVRKSRRINKEETEQQAQDELISNFHNGHGVRSRGTIIPTGTRRMPFLFNSAAADKRAVRAKDQLKIDMEPVFTPAGAVSQGFPSSSPPLTRKTPDPVHGFMETDRSSAIRVGNDFQAELEEYTPYKPRDQEPERDERMWTPPADDIEFNYDDLENVYWKTIWRQFESHIPMEVALKHLMHNRYILSDSLNTIDQTLKTLPQAFKPLCVAQAKIFKNLVAKKPTTRRTLQQFSMKNYHIAEVQNFHYRYRKFYKFQSRYGVVCNCYFPQCKDIVYEPRWACANCTFGLREQENPTEKTMCLVCLTYKQLTGQYRCSNDVVFHDFELAKIQEWEAFENQEKRSLTRSEYEQMAKEKREDRWRRNETTPEENDMLDTAKLRINNRKHKLTLTAEEEKIRGERIVEQLQPFVLPHFTKCTCSVWATETLLMIARVDFNTLEQQQYCAALEDSNGDCKLASIRLKVSPHNVKEFLINHGEQYGFEKIPADIARSGRIPYSNMPPKLPEDSSGHNSRESTPEDKNRAKRRRLH